MLNRQIRAFVLTIAAIGFLAIPVERGAAQTSLTNQWWCSSIGNDRLECTANPSGGVPPYTYYYTPSPIPPWTNDSYTIIPCKNAHYHTLTGQYGAWVTLKVTDSNGASLTQKTFWGCGYAN